MFVRRTAVLALVACFVACADDGGGGGSGTGTGAGAGTETGSTGAPDGSGDASTGEPATDDGTTSTPSTDGSTTDGADTTSAGDDVEDGGTSTSGASTASTGGSDTAVADCHPLLVQVVYDLPGGDDELQWVELYNPCDDAFDLSQFSIGYGGEDYGPPRVKGLQGSVEAGACWIVGGPTAAPANGDPDYDFSEDFAPGLDTAERHGGGIALFELTEDEVDATSVPIDAVVYGPDNEHGLVDDTGLPVPAPHVGNPAPGGAIRRTGPEVDWVAEAAPDAATCPPW